MKTQAHWEKIGFHPHHGIACPLFSLRTQKSCGIGEFFDLLLLIDWCKSLGLDVIQLLPLNDSGDDTSPYNAISSCALDPIYLSLFDLPDADPLSSDHTKFALFAELPRLARNEVKREKMQWLFSYFQKNFAATSQTDAYRTFVSEQSGWLKNYCLFKALKDEYGGKHWNQWPQELQAPQEKEFNSRQNGCDFHAYLQFHCFSQLEKVKAYASNQGIFLKGDIPILLSPDSVDVWAHPSLFDLHWSAGAPPDFYNPLGQKWGFPLFNWDEMRKEQFAWWKRRLKVATRLYHLYRIDHVVGFFRIWAIPPDKNPVDGHFVLSDPTLWVPQGREILEMVIDACPLLPIAEDLGTIPKEVRPLLRELGICGTNVVRWHRHWDGDRSYIPYNEYDTFTLTTVSTADADIVPVWWKNFPNEAIPFAHLKKWSYQSELTFEQLFEMLHDAHHTPSYFHINLLQEYLALFPELVSPNLEDERVNVPGTLLPTNWTHRYRPTLEELFTHKKFSDTVRDILKP